MIFASMVIWSWRPDFSWKSIWIIMFLFLSCWLGKDPFIFTCRFRLRFFICIPDTKMLENVKFLLSLPILSASRGVFEFVMWDCRVLLLVFCWECPVGKHIKFVDEYSSMSCMGGFCFVAATELLPMIKNSDISTSVIY